ncbi:MAG: ESPR domain-containing protein, partial [Snodgrassella sp.]
MNKIYRAIWNETTQTWVAASELAKSKTKANTVSAQTSVRSLIGKISLNTFKVGVITSLVNMSLAIPNAYAADR